jgi:hypothetical protein
MECAALLGLRTEQSERPVVLQVKSVTWLATNAGAAAERSFNGEM